LTAKKAACGCLKRSTQRLERGVQARRQPCAVVSGARTRPQRLTSGSGCGLVLTDQAGEDRPTLDPAADRLGDRRIRARRPQLQRPMRPPPVVVGAPARTAGRLRSATQPRRTHRSPPPVRRRPRRAPRRSRASTADPRLRLLAHASATAPPLPRPRPTQRRAPAAEINSPQPRGCSSSSATAAGCCATAAK